MSPHGVYRCHGDDAWVSIAIGSEEEWLGLVRALGNPVWARDDKFGDAYQRWLDQDKLDHHLEEWTARLSPQEVTRRLQLAGVAAFPSLSADQLMSDLHLLARDAFPTAEHPHKGQQRASWCAGRMSRSTRPTRRSKCAADGADVSPPHQRWR
jgi:crotonobetainyl-CoA:carnitine CoA-transferase CaiB-like acyl-CoA transferase